MLRSRRIVPAATASAKGTERGGPCARQPEVAELGDRQGLGRGEGVGEAELPKAAHRHPEPLYEPPGDRVSSSEGDLLTDDRAYAGLEGVPGSGHAEARSGLQQRPDDGVVPEVARGPSRSR